ncbi:kinase-like protein [Guyanagaster necrorhizus]|uniref:mitogen-activated protein kinase kinase n=1 Tax=Guyanagaster necrorhizus TaxID=856835 RepID=A0A9P7VRW8_9AGAR|nr:kinase-like protein [Guyanagaster necrorhizus MCA 3950]KAG7446311.1 kinase-like protein [Guyanagaster necrorhizus MCA 3950]
MQTHSRPMGPRSFRSASPAPPVNLPETAPLNIRKPRMPDALSPPRLVIPKASSPKPVIRVSIPAPNGSDNSTSGDSPIYDYYGGPRLNTSTKAPYGPDDMTIRPASSDTTRPALTQKPSEPIDEVRTLLTDLKIRTTSSSASDLQPEDDAIPAQKLPSLPWSDDVLEQVASLGEGAGGAVHKVKDKRTGKIMARKTITTRGAPMKQLLRELSIISSTEHINIILFHGAYISPSSSEVKILMELGEGGSLEAVGKRIKERGAVVGEKTAGRIAEGVLQGLAYLHRKKTIHRDIKPSNILLSREGIVKLCDFGVSGELIDSIAGTFTGTSMYMAPERICGHEYTIRSDVWSTGISLLELVQNRFPFPNDLPPIELMMYITTGEPPRLEDGGGLQWSDDMKDFIKETLTVDAMARPKPQDMLEHRWIVGVMKQEVNMARWIRQVWGWPKSSRRSRDQTNSRPSSSQRTDSSGGSPGGLDSSPNISST